MAPLMRRVAEDVSLVDVAKRIIRHGGESAVRALVAEAVSHKAEGIAAAEQLVGRRIVDLLGELAGSAQWFEVRPMVARLAREGDTRSMQAVEAMMRRADEQSRREVAGGLADAGSPAAMRLLGMAIKDPNTEVAVVAARAVARSGQPGATALLVGRLGELDIDGNDFILAREFIAALARVPESAAEEFLKKLAGRRALIKRGHFAEIQDLVARALEHRTKGGIGR
jgi:HEAT repeat protein